MPRLCVFCGSNVGRSAAYTEASKAVARAAARRGLGLVYGAGNIGLMGVLADEAIRQSVEIHGVIPTNLVAREVAHARLTQLHVVPDLQQRKALMAQLSDAFLTLPGGYGTLDELFEVMTWRQLEVTDKPSGLLNVEGFFDPLLSALDRAVDQGFVQPAHRQLLTVDTDVDRLISRLLPQ